MTNRWLPVVGGILMNLALGALYAWSVFVLPLEKEFGWTRARDLLGLHDRHRLFRAVVHRGRATPGSEGASRLRRSIGGVLVSAGFMLAQLHELAAEPLHLLSA